jgi:hypothetical protein
MLVDVSHPRTPTYPATSKYAHPGCGVFYWHWYHYVIAASLRCFRVTMLIKFFSGDGTWSYCARFGVARSSQAAFIIAGAISQMPTFNGGANGRDVACNGAAVDYGNGIDSGSGDARCGGDRTIPGDVCLADDFETVVWRPTIS